MGSNSGISRFASPTPLSPYFGCSGVAIVMNTALINTLRETLDKYYEPSREHAVPLSLLKAYVEKLTPGSPPILMSLYDFWRHVAIAAHSVWSQTPIYNPRTER